MDQVFTLPRKIEHGIVWVAGHLPNNCQKAGKSGCILLCGECLQQDQAFAPVRIQEDDMVNAVTDKTLPSAVCFLNLLIVDVKSMYVAMKLVNKARDT